MHHDPRAPYRITYGPPEPPEKRQVYAWFYSVRGALWFWDQFPEALERLEGMLDLVDRNGKTVLPDVRCVLAGSEVEVN